MREAQHKHQTTQHNKTYIIKNKPQIKQHNTIAHISFKNNKIKQYNTIVHTSFENETTIKQHSTRWYTLSEKQTSNNTAQQGIHE